MSECEHVWKQTEVHGTQCNLCGVRYQRPKWDWERIAELEQQLAELREAVDEVLNASVSSLEYRSNRLQLAVWDLRAVRDKALLQESGDE